MCGEYDLKKVKVLTGYFITHSVSPRQDVDYYVLSHVASHAAMITVIHATPLLVCLLDLLLLVVILNYGATAQY
jgi:hypothetical protein